MTTSKNPETLSLSTEYCYRNYLDAHFLRLAYAEDLTMMIGGNWITAGSLDDVPGELVGCSTYSTSGRNERILRIGSALCHLNQNENSLSIRSAATSRGAAESAIVEVKAVLPEMQPGESEVPARFWWWSPRIGATELARAVPYEPWGDARHNYAGQTRARLDNLSTWRDGPPAGGRLILWHGQPGTGKTSAIRTLAGEWRSWAEFHLVTDPEQFLNNPSYLFGAVTGTTAGPQRRRSELWRVIVLEDSGEFLAPDAKHANGQSLSRLLNVCDGVLGIAMRVLILITTNEAINQLHTAITRPGRCLSEVSFDPFNTAEITQWCNYRDVEPLGTQTAALADLYAHLEGRAHARKRAPVGFAAAA